MRRRGVTIFEMTIALLLAGVVLAGMAQLLAALASHRRESERRLAAIHEAANQMERLAVLPWSELTPEATAAWKLSQEAADALPAGELTVSISDAELPVEAPPAARRVEVEVAWRNSAGPMVDPVRVVAWRFPQEGQP
jgi:Tfp pilus assembly protein PilV